VNPDEAAALRTEIQTLKDLIAKPDVFDAIIDCLFVVDSLFVSFTRRRARTSRRP
jgi:hypothetical protein